MFFAQKLAERILAYLRTIKVPFGSSLFIRLAKWGRFLLVFPGSGRSIDQRVLFSRAWLRLEVSVIAATKLNGEHFMLNAELVELVESTPDTIISLTTGKKFMVKQTVDEIIERIIQYRRQISPFFDTGTA